MDPGPGWHKNPFLAFFCSFFWIGPQVTVTSWSHPPLLPIPTAQNSFKRAAQLWGPVPLRRELSEHQGCHSCIARGLRQPSHSSGIHGGMQGAEPKICIYICIYNNIYIYITFQIYVRAFFDNKIANYIYTIYICVCLHIYITIFIYLFMYFFGYSRGIHHPQALAKLHLQNHPL